MKFLKLTASFGKLKNETLELHGGLNVVELENEGGKSTWSAFIPALLYGVDTSERASAGRVPDKTRFKPWDGGAMEGSALIEKDGKTIRVERSGKGQTPMKQLRAVDEATGESLGLDGEALGRELTGVSREVFQRSALIRQGTLKIDGSADLERRLQALATGSEEDVPYGEAKKRLEDWQKSLKNRQGGETARLEDRLKTSDEKLARLAALSERIAKCRLVSDERAAEVAAAERELSLNDALDAQNRGRQIAKARMEASRLESEIKKLSGSKTPPTRDQLRALEARTLSCEELSRRAEMAKASAAKSEADAESYIPEKSPFDGLSGDEAVAKAAETERVAAKTRKDPTKTVFLILIALFALGTAALFAFSDELIGGIICACVLVAVIIARILVRSTSKKALAILRDKYGDGDILEMAARYRDSLGEKQRLDIVAQESRNTLAALENELAELEPAVLREASELLGGDGELSEIRPAIDAAYTRIGAMDDLFSRYEAACRYRDSISEGWERDDGKYELDENAAPTLDRQTALEKRREAQALLRQAERELYELGGELGAIGDPDELRAERERLGRELERARAEYEAISAALGALDEANSEISSRFSPLLNELAGRLFSKLTSGKYEKLYLTREMAARCQESGSPVSRDAAFLSAGASDQLYLAARLAICELLLPPGTPIILDDALAAFDERRMQNALACLSELAENRQIILFTCHEREKKWLEGND